MTDTFFISDTHFGHGNILRFKTKEGLPLRDFQSVEEMDEHMITQWNSVVKPNDKVYHLGDVVIAKKSLKTFERLNGRKTLIAGNHDIFNTKEYLKVFDNVRAYKHYPEHGIIFSHIPVHPSQLDHRFKWNVHGHLHSNNLDDFRYWNICVEQINYTPISFNQILDELTVEAFLRTTEDTL